jgi:hypothetical protein
MTTPIDLEHLRHVRLTPMEVQTITLLARNGGEIAWHPKAIKNPETIRRIDDLQLRDLVQIVKRFPEQLYLRLTDQGRAVAAQLETMSVQPKVEVNQA